MSSKNEWIYAYTSPDSDMNDLFEKLEDALGFRLWGWVKCYIERGHFRQIGATTARCLRALVIDPDIPIVFINPPADHEERFERNELHELKAKLDSAGISTSEILDCTKRRLPFPRKYF